MRLPVSRVLAIPLLALAALPWLRADDEPPGPPPAYNQDLPQTWNLPLGIPGLPSVPALLNGRAFINGGNIVCLDLSTGKPLWTVEGETEDEYPDPPLPIPDATPPAVAVTNGRGRIVVLAAENGKEVWSTPESQPFRQAPARSKNLLLAIDDAGTAYAFDVATGHERWRRTLAVEPVLQPVTVDGSGLAFAVVGQHLYAFDAETGRAEWDAGFPSIPVSRPAVRDDFCLLLLSNGRLIALDRTPADGVDDGIPDEAPEKADWIWDVDCSPPWKRLAPAMPRVTLLLLEELVLISDETDHFYAMNIEDGSPGWRSNTHYLGSPHSPMLWHNQILVPGPGWIQLVDPETGVRTVRAVLPDLPTEQFLAIDGDRLIATERAMSSKAACLDLTPLLEYLPK